ncbi:gluconate 2-dehydrogenase [Alteribacillus persepolensis]|uniref:Gluconate 2-dehydrogenase n=1 Tax=Alteribacillus persepolensis TaxID=568899 RepID=A0A1G8AXZ6_9BACI|nr:D-glycerate dehydrogenase [Alteribacillus persepolensis]SDH25757.1 gluconate 2-dehydrogenase [Alteribacillus persepolensis]
MKQKVVAYGRVQEAAQRRLGETYEVTHFPHGVPLSDPALQAALTEASAFIGGEFDVGKELLDLAPDLKVVSNVSVGYDNLDIDELTKRGIAATNTPDVLNDTTADAIFGLLLAAARRIPELNNYVKGGGWQGLLPDSKFGVDVHHKTLGIIGMGRIGEAIAKRAHFGFDMKILYHNRSKKPELEKTYNASHRSLNHLLEEADFVCLMTPLTEETYHLMGKPQFERMQKHAVFVNGSRGQTVDEAALVDALNNGEIRAAGLDVFQEEPVSVSHPLLQMDQVVATPHIGSATKETEEAMSMVAAKNVDAVLQGSRPPNLINHDVELS